MKHQTTLAACIFISMSSLALAQEQVILPDITLDETTSWGTAEEANRPSALERQSNTTVVTAREIEDNHYTNVQQVLRQVNGVTVNNAVPGISSYVELNGDDRVAILVDGQRIGTNLSAQYGSRGTVDLQTLPGVEQIERIEVTKGSGSVKYGSGAVGGVINIITKKGGAPQTTLDVSTGSWGTHQYTLTNSGSSGNTSWYVTGGLSQRRYYAFDGDGYDKDQNRGDYQKNFFTARIDQKLDDAQSLTFYASHSGMDGHVTDIVTTDKKKPLWPYQVNAKPVEELINTYSATYHFGQDGDTPGYIRYFNEYNHTLWTNDFSTRTQGVQAENSWHLGSTHLLTAGAEWTMDQGTNEAADILDRKRTNRAAYVEDVMTFGKLSVTPGLRLDDNSQFGFHKTPRVAVNYAASDQWNVYANWSRVFAAPKLNDLYYSNSVRNSYGNPDLRPEEGYTQNMGVSYRPDARTEITVNLFRSSLSDAIRWNRTETLTQVENLNKEKKRGIELTLNKRINDAWDYELGYSYTQTKIDEGDGKGLHLDETYNRPNGYHGAVNFHRSRWTANVTVNAGTGRIADYGPGRNDDYFMHGSYVTWDAGVTYAVNDALTLYGQVQNLTDEGYDLYHNYPSEGRFFLAGATYRF